MNENDKKEFVFDKVFFKSLFPCLKEFTDLSQPLPKFGFLIRRNYLKKELLFYKVITRKSDNLEKSEEMCVELVISGVENN